MKFKEWKKAVEQGYEDPCEYQEETRCCEICDIEESKTYFVEETNTCQDCYEEKEQKEYIEKYIIPNETNENIKLFYNGCLEYDKEYIKEHKKYNKEYKTCDKCCYDILDDDGDIMVHECIERYCPKCDNELKVEKEIDYPYVCFECDENFYEFETIKRTNN